MLVPQSQLWICGLCGERGRQGQAASVAIATRVLVLWPNAHLTETPAELPATWWYMRGADGHQLAVTISTISYHYHHKRLLGNQDNL
jgi:hypothetical protein